MLIHFNQTTKSGTHDSDSCLKEGTCLPLGGYRLVSLILGRIPIEFLTRNVARIYDLFSLIFDKIKFMIYIIWIYLTFYHLCVLNLKGSVWSALPPINISSSVKPKPIVMAMASMDSGSFFRDKSIGAESPISVSCLFVVLIFTLRKQLIFFRENNEYRLTKTF